MNIRNKGLSYRDAMDMAKRRSSDLYRQQILQNKFTVTAEKNSEVILPEESNYDDNEKSNISLAENDDVTPDLNRSPDKTPPVSPLKELEEVYSRYLS